MQRSRAPLLSRFLAYVAAPLLVAYLGLLLVTTYLAQQDLQVATANERRLELEKRAAALSYFYSERRSDIARLASDRALTVFFSNRALGMSMQYGLRASLLSMQGAVEQLLRSETIAGRPLYLRILILDTQDEVVLDVGAPAGAPPPAVDPVPAMPGQVSLRVVQELEGDRVLLTQPVEDRGQRLGAVVAEVSHAEALRSLVQTPGGRPCMVLLARADGAAPSPELGAADPKGGQGARAGEIQVPVADTPFVLIAPNGSSESAGLLVSGRYLGLLAGLAVVVLLVLVIGIRDGSRNLALSIRYEEQQRQSDLLNRQNERLEAEVAQRKKSEAFIRTLVETLPDLVWLKDLSGVFLFCNPQFARLYGLDTTDIIGKTDLDLRGAHQAAAFLRDDPGAIAAGQAGPDEEQVTFAGDGHQAVLETIRSPMYDADGHLIGILGIARDITDRKRAEERLRTLSQAVEQSPVPVMITDPRATIEYVNAAFERMTGYRRDEVLGRNARLLKSGSTQEAVYQDLWGTILSGQGWHGELEDRRKDGSVLCIRSHISPVRDDKGQISHFVGLKEDITVQKQQERKVLHQAHFDALTDLPNRFLALDRLAQLIREARRQAALVAVLFLDLDDFKTINDTLGHEIGDQVLVQAAQRLRSGVREVDTVGRLGGDEFIVLVGDLRDPANARGVAEKLLRGFRESFRVGQRDLKLTASIGIALYPADGETPAELLRRADMAMYRAKEQGRNTYQYFTEALNRRLARRLAVEEQLHGALERRELSVVYQPLMELGSGRIVGAEALLRWQSPVLGTVEPGEFIPMAESSGLIVPIGQHVLREAAETVVAWRRTTGADLVISVNVSPRQLSDRGFAPDVARLLEHARCRGQWLRMEITEGVLLAARGEIDDALQGISALGVHLAMDDFGTGYSSLSYLRRHAFDWLKIDRDFIADLGVDAATGELVSAAIAMAHGLGLHVVGEGVENELQLRGLAERGCDLAQGHLIGLPVLAQALPTELLARPSTDSAAQATPTLAKQPMDIDAVGRPGSKTPPTPPALDHSRHTADL